MKSKKMSITQTYYLAHTARSKLSKEASRGDHDLRVLVGHANLLDGLMGDLATAEREADYAFASSSNKSQRVTWATDLPTPTEEVEDAEVSDASSDEEAEDIEVDDENDSSLALVRTPSRSSPPELLEEEDDEDSDDDSSMPPSPPAAPQLTFSDKKTAHDENDDSTSFYEDGFYLPRRGAVVVY